VKHGYCLRILEGWRNIPASFMRGINFNQTENINDPHS